MIRVDAEPPPMYFINEMTDCQLHGHQLPAVSRVALLLGLQGLGPQPQWSPGPIHELIQTSPQSILTSIRR